MRIACLLLIAAALVPFGAEAQPVAGVVVERGTNRPVPGAMVILFDSLGTGVDRTLTNAAGRFSLRARAPGPHHISVQRIGYVDWTTERFRPTAAGPRLTISVPFEAITLEGLAASGERRCEVRPEEGKATARVWDEARKALAAEAYTRESGLYRYTLLHYTRKLDRNARKILDEQVKAAKYMPGAFVSFPIDSLLTRGFVQLTDSNSVYRAPDAETFLSDAFLDTHCFGLTEGDGGRIGLTFEPLPARTVPEIKGVLWLNAATSELERLEFLYQNLLPNREFGEPGGEVAFTRLPNGAWIVREWAVRGPNLTQPLGGRLRRTGYTEVSGITWAITNTGGSPILHAKKATITGVVTDSALTGPPPGPVVVEALGTNVQAVTEEDGSFLLPGLDEGPHVLVVQRPLLAGWGLGPPEEVKAEGRLGKVVHVRLRAPTVADALVASCGGAPRPPGTAAFMGRITEPGGAPLDRMTVSAAWAVVTGYTPPAVAAPAGLNGEQVPAWKTRRDKGSVIATTTTDWRGIFLLCDVPGGLRLRVSVKGPADAQPVLIESFVVERGATAVVEELVVPVGGGNQ